MLLSRRVFFKARIHDLSRISRNYQYSRPSITSLEWSSKGSTLYDALQIADMKQRHVATNPKGSRIEFERQIRQGSNEEVLDLEVQALLDKYAEKSAGKNGVALSSEGDGSIQKSNTAGEDLPEPFSEIEIEINELSSTGDGLALAPSGSVVYIVPFTIPGDRALAKVVNYNRLKPFASTDLIKVVRPSSKRKDAGIRCKYFGTCSGCQLQMLSYEDQLAHKKTILEKAYKNFSGLNPNLIPPISDTYGSPLEYEYRTKLTPHFDSPRRRNGELRGNGVPAIGFTAKGRRKVLEIEDCPISTPIVREGLKRERARVIANIDKYRSGATILLRESTNRIPKSLTAPYAIKEDIDHLDSASEAAPPISDPTTGRPTIRKEFSTYIEEKTYISDSNATSVEYVDNWKFINRAGSFFQNNNSILGKFTAYVRDHALPPVPKLAKDPQAKYLLDAYCGSGLFAITLSTLFKSTLGIDIDCHVVSAARANAVANNVANIGFIEADAASLFAGVPFPPAQTVVLIDPPRRGCSDDFLQQLLSFAPKRVVYVSCNVHTQARDVGLLVQGRGPVRYEIESLRGFDFFPQTGHVEGVAFLNRV